MSTRSESRECRHISKTDTYITHIYISLIHDAARIVSRHYSLESVDTYQRLTRISHVSHTYLTRISHVSHTYLTRIKDSHQGTHVMSRRCLGGNSFLSTLPTLTSHRRDDCASYRGYERVTSCHGMKE